MIIDQLAYWFKCWAATIERYVSRCRWVYFQPSFGFSQYRQSEKPSHRRGKDHSGPYSRDIKSHAGYDDTLYRPRDSYSGNRYEPKHHGGYQRYSRAFILSHARMPRTATLEQTHTYGKHPIQLGASLESCRRVPAGLTVHAPTTPNIKYSYMYCFHAAWSMESYKLLQKTHTYLKMTGKAFLLKIELSKLYFTGVITRSLDGGHTTTTLVMTNLTTATKPEPSTAKTATNTKKSFFCTILAVCLTSRV